MFPLKKRKDISNQLSDKKRAEEHQFLRPLFNRNRKLLYISTFYCSTILQFYNSSVFYFHHPIHDSPVTWEGTHIRIITRGAWCFEA